jgi:hypothetical protein
MFNKIIDFYKLNTMFQVKILKAIKKSPDTLLSRKVKKNKASIKDYCRILREDI